jgi:anti-sigma factor ChrR (cupin superfamily)
MSLEMTEDRFGALAAPFALGALEGEERAAFEAHLAGCAACAAAVERESGLLTSLPRGLEHVAPLPAERERLLDLARAPHLPVALDTFAWEEVAPGIRLHTLWEDPARGARGCLAWAKAGARTLLHRHTGDELILVLSGGLRDERGEYHEGDLCRSRPGSVHTEQILPDEDCIAYVVYYGSLEPV